MQNIKTRFSPFYTRSINQSEHTQGPITNINGNREMYTCIVVTCVITLGFGKLLKLSCSLSRKAYRLTNVLPLSVLKTVREGND